MELAKIKHGRFRGTHVNKRLNIDGRYVRVDVNIADLVEGLNKLDILTWGSCGGSCMGHCRRKHRLIEVRNTYYMDENGKKRRTKLYRFHKPKLCRESISIAFETTKDALRFMKVVFRASDPKTLQDHMQGFGRKQSHAWSWHCKIDDINDQRVYSSKTGKQVGPGIIGPPRFDFYCVVVIPHAHLTLVTERVLERCLKRGV